ncbi:MAG: hypothetical protein ACI82Q_001667 [Nonlabens sp.]
MTITNPSDHEKGIPTVNSKATLVSSSISTIKDLL